MRVLYRRDIFDTIKNGKNFRFLWKENNDEGETKLLEGLLKTLSKEERFELILKLTNKHRDKVQNVLDGLNINESGTSREKKSAPEQKHTVPEKIQTVQQKVEAVLDEKAEEKILNQVQDDKAAEKPGDEENTTEHNRDRAHQDLDKKDYEQNKKSPLEEKNSAVAEDIKKFREDVDVYIKRALPDKGLALKQGSDEVSRRYAIEKHVLNEIQIFADPIWSDLRPRLQNYESKITNFASEYISLKEETDPNIKFLKQKELVESFRSHIQAWEQLTQKIRHAKEQLVEVCQKVMGIVRGKMFARDYFQGFDMYVDGLGKTLKDFDALAVEKNYDFSGKEIFWETIPKRIQVIRKYLNFNDGGKLNQFSADSTEIFKKQANGIKFLHRSQFFEEDGNKKFRENFGKSVNRVKEFKHTYQRKFHQVKSILTKALNNLDEKDFFAKYQQTKQSIYEYISGQEAQLDRFGNAVGEYGKRKFVSNWVNLYNHSSTRTDALGQMTAWAEFDTAVTNAQNPKNDEYKIISELEAFTQNENRPQKPNVTYFSLHDVRQMFTEYVEYRKRLWNRRSEQAVAALGVKAFGSDDPRTNSQIAKEFEKKDEETEDARVNEYKTQKGSMNVWDVQEDLYNANSADEARACIDLLIDKGAFEWTDPKLWWTLNRLEGFQRFKESDRFKDRGTQNRKLREAISNIWKEDYYNDWDKKLAPSRQSAMEGFFGEYDSYETASGDPRAQIMGEMVRKAYAGERDGLEPARFEAFIIRGIEYGKQNGGPRYDQRLWFLIHGVASGLLGQDAFARINGKFLYAYTPIDFFTDDTGWKKDGRLVPPHTPGAKIRPWLYNDFVTWGDMLDTNGGSYQRDGGFNGPLSKFVYNIMMDSESLRDRTQRGVRGGAEKWDHDDAAIFAPVLDATDVGMLLTAKSDGTEQMTADFWRQFLSEYKFIFHALLRQIDDGDREFGPDNVEWQKKRKLYLKRVGERVRAGLTIVQTLSGNVGIADGRLTMPFSDDKWNKPSESGYSPLASDSKGVIDDIAGIFLKNANIDETERNKYQALLKFSAMNIGKTYKNAKITVDGKEYSTQEEVRRFVIGDTGNKIFSSDFDVIERSLREFCKGNPVLPGE